MIQHMVICLIDVVNENESTAAYTIGKNVLPVLVQVRLAGFEARKNLEAEVFRPAIHD
jgi:hypothetical protein